MEFLDLNGKLVNDSEENLQQNPVNDDDEIIRDENNIITSEQEEVFQMEEKEDLRDNLKSLRGDLLAEYKHLAIDIKAKWELKTLFNS
ncbi:6646_t:CDS:2, partial [Funneliformis mosseae]